MNKYNSERLESLKVQFYKVIGSLEIQKNIKISDQELHVFEKNFEICTSEEDAASCILGATRRYQLMLGHVDNRLSVPSVDNEPPVVTEPSVNHSQLENNDITTIFECVETYLSSSSTDLPTDNIPQSEASPQYESYNYILQENEGSATSRLDHNINNENELPISNVELNENPDLLSEMPLTNDLLTDTTCISDIKLTSIRENNSIFMKFGQVNNVEVGCVFTLKRNGKYPRYECKNCRKLADATKKKNKGIIEAHNKPAALTLFENRFHEYKKEFHNENCRVETLSKSFSRSVKNEAVQFKSLYGGTSKQVYDGHVKILATTTSERNIDISAQDIASGFKTFDKAKSALKKSGQRKCATKMPITLDNGRIDKSSTCIVKTIPNEEADFFLISQNLESGTTVLGTKFMAKKFFESKKVLADGTFKIAPIGFTQCYILWFIVEGKVDGEDAVRSKAIPAIYFLLKGKNTQLYEEAFKALEDYRDNQNIQFPAWEEFLMDDEVAVQNIVTRFYPNTKISLCLFHTNKNMVKCLVDHKLTEFIRKCRSDIELWFYGKFKEVLVLALLPHSDIQSSFIKLRNSILGYIESNIDNEYQINQFKDFFSKIEKRYFSNLEKMQKMCKFQKYIRTTNLIEAAHGAFNKSTLLPKNGAIINVIQGLQIIDLEFRTIVVDFDTNGVTSLQKKSQLYQDREKAIIDATINLTNKTITSQQFLEVCAKAMINEQYYKLIKEASAKFEAIGNPDDFEETNEGQMEYIEAIFSQAVTNKRVKKICTKYFGEEWVNF